MRLEIAAVCVLWTCHIYPAAFIVSNIPPKRAGFFYEQWAECWVLFKQFSGLRALELVFTDGRYSTKVALGMRWEGNLTPRNYWGVSFFFFSSYPPPPPPQPSFMSFPLKRGRAWWSAHHPYILFTFKLTIYIGCCVRTFLISKYGEAWTILFRQMTWVKSSWQKHLSLHASCSIYSLSVIPYSYLHLIKVGPYEYHKNLVAYIDWTTGGTKICS